MITHFNSRDLQRTLDSLPIESGDLLFIHSNLGFFGRQEEARSESFALCEMFFDAIMEKIAPTGTLVVPTFTYSFQLKKIYDPSEPIQTMGIFSEWIRCHPDASRSMDPCYSVAAIGSSAISLIKELPSNSFGNNSFFDRFYKSSGKILNMNFDAGSTFIHFVERQLSVPYRFDKTFHGLIKKDGVLSPSSSTIWVRYRSDDALQFDSKPFSNLAHSKGLFHQHPLGRGQIGLITAHDTYQLIHDTLPMRPLFLTKAESMGVTDPCIIPESQGEV